MFKNAYQTGCLPLLNSVTAKPLAFWSKQVRTGHVKRVHDEDLAVQVLEIIANSIKSTFITCPRDPLLTLGIRLPIIAFQLKNIGKCVSFDIQVLDDRNVRRRFHASSVTNWTKIRPLVCTLPLKLIDGWNDIQINLVELTQRAYATHYVEATRLQLTASCRVRRIHFAERFHAENELATDISRRPLSLSSPRHGATNDHRTKHSIFDNCPPLSHSSAK